ncbi:hypothetical protein AVEN_262471-1 [Araneus ventricosus]|uniref:Uncharacterized protein n=1 Tax=Araneus ventricosus TaxID=182803 RepID=A0A4Y2GAI8_ARAVE|nr:hypothetical protein AVEN_262471-1 [Araneus ventricosus]
MIGPTSHTIIIVPTSRSENSLISLAIVESAFSSNGLQSNGQLHFPPGVLGLKLRKHNLDRAAVRSAVLFFSNAMTHCSNLSSWTLDKDLLSYTSPVSCWFGPDERREAFANFVFRSVLKQRRLNGSSLLAPVFDIYNLVPHPGRPLHHVTDFDEPIPRRWKRIGNVTGSRVSLNAVFWLNKKHVGPPQKGQERFRVVTAFAPPFVMRATRVENESCLLGLPCLQGEVSPVSTQRLTGDTSFLSREWRDDRLIQEHGTHPVGIDVMLLSAKRLTFRGERISVFFLFCIKFTYSVLFSKIGSKK